MLHQVACMCFGMQNAPSISYSSSTCTSSCRSRCCSCCFHLISQPPSCCFCPAAPHAPAPAVAVRLQPLIPLLTMIIMPFIMNRRGSMDQDVRSSFSCTNSGAVTVSSCVLPPRVADGSDNVAALVHALIAVNDRLCEIRRLARWAGSTGSSAAASGHSDAGEPAVMAVNAVLRI